MLQVSGLQSNLAGGAEISRAGLRVETEQKFMSLHWTRAATTLFPKHPKSPQDWQRLFGKTLLYLSTICFWSVGDGCMVFG